MRSKPTPIHVPVRKSDLDYSYSRSHFSQLPQAVAKILVFLSRGVSYAFKKFDPVINIFIPHEVISHMYSYSGCIVKSVIRVLCLGF